MSDPCGHGQVASGWVRLEDTAVLAFSGGAARAFLGRQLTCDVTTLAPAQALLGAWLTAKGRVLALLRLVDPGDGRVLALLPRELADEVVKRMRLFVLRDDVAIEPAADLAVAGLAGKALSAPDAAPGDDGLPALVPVAEGLALLVADSAALDTVLGGLEGGGHPALSAGAWTHAQVRAGIPHLAAANREAFLPQMLNLDRLQAVSFSKGCYPGQEIVARTQHLGRIKRRMFIARCGSAAPVAAPGDAIAGSGGGEAAGRVVLAAVDGGGQEMLAVLSLDAVAGGEALHLGSASGPALEVRPPPYPLGEPGA